MKSLNRVELIGYLGAAPELQISKNGKSYSRLRVATHRNWMNAEDKWETKTDWHSVFIWGPLADRCCHTLEKGNLIFVEGSLTYWQAALPEGYKNAIHANEVKFLAATKSAATAPSTSTEPPPEVEDLDNPAPSRNHNAVAHPA